MSEFGLGLFVGSIMGSMIVAVIVMFTTQLILRGKGNE